MGKTEEESRGEGIVGELREISCFAYDDALFLAMRVELVSVLRLVASVVIQRLRWQILT